MVAADSRFDYLSCADGSWSNKLHGILIPKPRWKSPVVKSVGGFYDMSVRALTMDDLEDEKGCTAM